MMNPADLLKGANGLFSLMGVSEDVIAEYKERHPDKVEELHDSFVILYPTVPLRGKSDELYRSHVRELLNRVVDGEDTNAATRAEVLGFLSDVSIRKPLSDVQMEAMTSLFASLFPMSDAATKLVPSAETSLLIHNLTRELAVKRRG